ncbi:MAG: 4-hydroxybenzoate octaprenyltransferase [Planctomycetes bacterium]|nr:4-hydroxybenzoate octaprenyltransferase [Planctomycetota bacterium]
MCPCTRRTQYRKGPTSICMTTLPKRGHLPGGRRVTRTTRRPHRFLYRPGQIANTPRRAISVAHPSDFFSPPLRIRYGPMPSTPVYAVLALARDIKVSHSVFALPFALLATFLAAGGMPGGTDLALIVVCMFFARTFAMLANRYLDRAIDRHNPRTAGRALPAGRLRPAQVMAAMAFCAIALIAAAAMFGVIDQNWWPLIFAPLVLAWLGAYGLMKRYTLLCHFFLGAALALSPLAAALAIRPAYLTEPTLWYLAGFVLLWVGGFDIIYAMQDIDHDTRDGLHSIPAKLGPTAALALAKLAHLLAVVLLILMQRSSLPLGRLFFIGIVIVALALIFEHLAASRGRFTMAFFTLNGFISLTLGALGVIDVFM